jgi:hypothetical protein
MAFDNGNGFAPAPAQSPAPGLPLSAVPLKVAEDKLRMKLGVVEATFKRGQRRLAIVDTALQS